VTSGYYIHLRVYQHIILPEKHIEPFHLGTSINIHGYLQDVTKKRSAPKQGAKQYYPVAVIWPIEPFDILIKGEKSSPIVP
jgi:hypothetical protein